MRGDTATEGIDNPHDLMTRNDRAFVGREIAFHGVQIRVAKAAGAYSYAYLAGTGSWDRKVSLAKRVLFDRTCMLKH
jgi:hypothetical protein